MGRFVLIVPSLKNQELSEMNKHGLEVSNVINFHRPVGGEKKKSHHLAIPLDSKRSKINQPLKIRLLSGRLN